MNRHMAEAWRKHSEASGHIDGIAEHHIAYCLNCDWVFTEGAESAPDAITLRDSDEGWSEGTSTFVRDADEMRMARPD